MKIIRKLALVWSISAITFCAHALDRQAFTFTSYDLKVTLDPAKQGFAVTGTVQARNDSTAPQKNLVLQVSSAFQWTAAAVGQDQIPWVQQTYTTDIDHTGEVSEAILTLLNAVAPGASVTVTFSYEGALTLNTGRLLRVNTPGTYAARSDWDQVSDSFTAVRGLGYVAWYPVSMDAVSLNDGPALWDRIANWRLRHRSSILKVSFVAPAGKVLVTNADEANQMGYSLDVIYRSLATVTPTFSLAVYQVIERPGMTVYYLAQHTQIARDYVNAAEKVLPEVSDFFGIPKQKLVVVELPSDDVLPFDDGGAVYFTPMMKLEPEAEEIMMGHQLVHTIITSTRPWIDEGLGHLAQLLIRERQGGRDAALAFLNQFRETLATTEKEGLQAAPGKGDPLATSNDQIMFRSKSSYVWFMIRDLVGEKALSAAIHNYNPAQDTQPAYMQSLLESQTNPRQSLEQFFDDWVYRDKGLPDFKVAAVYPRATLGRDTYIVTVTAENTGDASAPIVVGVMSEKGERKEKGYIAAHGKTVIRISYPGTPTKAWVNDGSVPEADVTNNTADIKNLPPNPQP
jgi:hypothetical protein